MQKNDICIKISKTMKKHFLLITIIIFLSSCKLVKEIANNSTHNIQVGGNLGGIVTNREVDAVSGATKMNFNIGYHNTVKIKKHHIETGIDFLRHKQIFEFTETEFTGKRSFTYSEIRFPATYNFHLFKKNNNGRLIGKLGFSYGVRINENIKDSDNLPEYSFKKSSFGLDFGLEVRPFKVNEKLDLGFF